IRNSIDSDGRRDANIADRSETYTEAKLSQPPRLPRPLVADHPLQMGKTPFVNAFCFACLTNPVQVFKDDPLIIRFRVGHDLFADAVISVRDKTPLTTRDTLPAPVWRSCYRWPGEIVSSFCRRIFYGGYSSPCGIYCPMSPPRG